MTVFLLHIKDQILFAIYFFGEGKADMEKKNLNKGILSRHIF